MNEQMEQNLAVYKEKQQKKTKRNCIITIVFWGVLLSFYLYLRLFNTQFVYEDGELQIKYSTAWYVRVPSQYEGEEVVSVCDSWGDHMDSNYLPFTTYVYFEDGKKYVDGFEGSAMMGVRLPNTIELIDGFTNCERLRFIELPEKVPNGLSIWPCAFAGTALRKIALPEGTTEVWYGAFNKCRYLREVVIPDSVVYMDSEDRHTGVFYGCERLRYVDLPDCIETIDGLFFRGCYSLEEVDWPSSLKRISVYALKDTLLYNKPVEELGLPSSVFCAHTKVNTLLNIELENEYLAEETGIPIDVLEQAYLGHDVWIEGEWYSFPIKPEELSANDSWKSIVEFMNLQIENGYAVGFEVENKYCGVDVVLPGGIVVGESDIYRLKVLEAMQNGEVMQNNVVDYVAFSYSPFDEFNGMYSQSEAGLDYTTYVYCSSEMLRVSKYEFCVSKTE